MSHKTFGNYTKQLEFAAEVITNEPLDAWETYAEEVKIALRRKTYHGSHKSLAKMRAEICSRSIASGHPSTRN